MIYELKTLWWRFLEWLLEPIPVPRLKPVYIPEHCDCERCEEERTNVDG